MKQLLFIFLIGILLGAGGLFFFMKPGDTKADLTKVLIYMKALEGKSELILARTQNQETFSHNFTDQSPLARLLRALFGPYAGLAQIDLQCVVDYNYYVDLDDPSWKFHIAADTLLNVTAPSPKLLKPPGLHTPSLKLNIGRSSIFINERDRYDELVRSLTDTLSSIGEQQLSSNQAIHDTCRARLEKVLAKFSNLVNPEVRSARVSFSTQN